MRQKLMILMVILNLQLVASQLTIVTNKHFQDRYYVQNL